MTIYCINILLLLFNQDQCKYRSASTIKKIEEGKCKCESVRQTIQ